MLLRYLCYLYSLLFNATGLPGGYLRSLLFFALRWAMLILPKNFIRVRHYGKFSPKQRKAYLDRCRQLLGIDDKPEGDGSDASGAAVMPTKNRSTNCCRSKSVRHPRFGVRIATDRWSQ